MTAAATVLGWLLALGGLGAGVALRRALARREAEVARASHELRGPLTAMRMVLHAAGRDREACAAGASWTRWLAAIELEADRARLAVADLERRPLRAASGTAYAPPPQAAELVDVAALLRCQGAGWAAAAPSVGREVRIAIAREGLLVRGDAARLAQAIGNLLANAMEHGAGTVVLSAAPAGGRVRIEVADAGRGLGLPVERLLTGCEASRGRRGHGLAVAAEAAALHGGRLITRPSAGGARLVLELPAASLAEDAIPEAS